jgi:thymidylate synthase
MSKIYETLSEAYLGTLEDIWFNPEYKCSPRGQAIREITNYSFKVLKPTSDSIVTKDLARNVVIADYTDKEKKLYDSGSNKVEDFAKASKFWNNIANPDKTITSAYGYLIYYNKSHGNPAFETHNLSLEEFHRNPRVNDYCMRTPYEWAKQALIADKDTRQALIRFSLPEHFWVGTRDLTCTLHMNFLIRDDKLNMSVVLRSNDLVKGLVYDASWFVSVQERMLADLKSTYPNLEIGEYYHMAHSLHAYERDEKVILGMLGK